MMPGGSRHLQDEALITALVGGATTDEAAALAHMSRRTVLRRTADPAFRARLADARAGVLGAVVGKLTSSSSAAVERLSANLNAESGHVSNGAARTLIEFAFRGAELLDLAGRVAALEARLAELPESAGEGGP